MAMAKVSSDNGIATINGSRWFGRARENDLEDVDDRLSPVSEWIFHILWAY